MLRQLLLFAVFGTAIAENGRAGWLRYAPTPNSESHTEEVPSYIIALNSTKSSPVFTAATEIQKGIQGMFGKNAKILTKNCRASSSIVVGTIDQYANAGGKLNSTLDVIDDGFWLSTVGNSINILGANERGALYGTFEYLSLLAQGNFSKVAYTSNPDAPIRWVNQWDNMDGSIERGFAGSSIFFKNGHTVEAAEDLARIAEYGRLLASVGINGIVVNNVNANDSLLKPSELVRLGRVADTLRPYGVQVGISLYFGSPKDYGLSTYDPLDPGVIAWWNNITDQIYQQVPDLAGYLVKANSEGQPGPLTYNRTLAQGANLFARALKPHGGVVMFRAFVYNQLNESDWKADRAKAAVEFFKDLDGQFDDNVVIQIKYGPIDFQVREPASPLFANLFQTNMAIELQVTQEYLGQQCHLVYLPPLWKTVLGFDLRVNGQQSLVRDIVSGRVFNRLLGGYAAVVNVGTNETWLGSHLAMSNFYAYGRLAWDPTADHTEILQSWTRLTFGLDTTVLDTIIKMSLDSWPAYENYSGNLGLQTLTDILYTHYGPNPASQDNNGWGQWTRADQASIGMDRTVANGTGYSGQYPSEVAQVYEDIDTTPDDLLLWFHHVDYTHLLKLGESVIQHFYDAHYDGAETVSNFPKLWESLKGKVDDGRFGDVLERLTYQAGHSIVWRDAINDFYYNLSSIDDAKKRVGNHPWRIEAEDMDLVGYKAYQVSPFETASNSVAIITESNTTTGTATAKVNFPDGTYDIAVNYFDLYGGRSHWSILLNDELIGEWSGPDATITGHTPSVYLDGHSAIRITFPGVKVRQGDAVKIIGIPDKNELAPVDYMSFLPEGIVD